MNKIFLLIDSLGEGGAQRQFVYLAQGLKARGYDVRCFYYWPNLDFYRPFLEQAGVPFIACREAGTYWKRFFHILRAIRDFHPDTVIAYLDTPSIMACLARCCCRFRLIVSERNTTQQLRWRDRIKYTLFHRADAIVPNSETQGDFLRRHYPGLTSRIHVITNTIDAGRFTPPACPPQNAVPRIISVGRMTSQKNYLGMVEAVHLLHERGLHAEFHWYLGKRQNAEYPRQVQERIEAYRLTDCIHMHPANPNIEEAYRCSDIFWLASFYEGFPNVLCEAMSCGLPVVCSKVCDNPYIVAEGVHGFLADPDCPQEMADALERLLHLSPEQRRKMGRAGAEHIASLCAEEPFLTKYMQLL